MTARDTYQTTVKSAGSSKIATLTANQAAQQETINASGANVGYHPGSSSSSASYEAAVKAANIAKWNADFAAEHAKQVAINAARDTLRATGDTAPA